MTEVRTLKYGDIIRIHGKALKGNKPNQGVIISKGFTDPNIYYLKCNDINDINFYQETLFQIMPKINFHIHDELLSLNLTPEERQAIKLRAKSQLQTFHRNFEIEAKTDILYGADVLLKHINTQFYLRGFFESARSGQGSFKLQLTQQLSSFSQFKIKSHRSYDEEGHKIYLDDYLQIHHPKTDCYMNYDENEKTVFIDQIFEQPSEQQINMINKSHYISIPQIKTSPNARIQVLNQSKSKTLWKFCLHQDYQSTLSQSFIKPHDIVYFEHTKQQGLVTNNLFTLFAYLKQNKDSQKNTFYDCLWQIIPIEDAEQQQYNIRNIITGKFLCVKFNLDGTYVLSGDGVSNQVQQQDEEKKGYDENAIKKIIVKKMKNSKDVENDLKRGSLVALGYQEDDNSFKYLDRGDEIINQNLENQKKIITYYEMGSKKYNFKIVEVLTQHSFKIQKPSNQDIYNIKFILSSSQIINKFCQLLSIQPIYTPEQINNDQNLKKQYFDQLFSKLDKSILDQLIFTLKAVIGKIYDTTYQEIQNAGNSPNQKIQKMIVETGVAQLIIKAIQLLALHHDIIAQIYQEYRSLMEKIITVFEFSYILFEKIAIGFEQNRIYVSRWSGLIMQHSCKINRQCIQLCLVSILENNKISIQAIVDESKIIQLIDLFRKQAQQNKYRPNIKYLKLFSTFIKIDGNVLRDNQKHILNHFFLNKQNNYRFRFSIMQKQNISNENQNNLGEGQKIQTLEQLGKFRQVWISFLDPQNPNKQMKMSTIRSFFYEHEYLWNYFLAYVNLMADVCIKRNSDSIRPISQSLSLQTVLIILSDPKIKTLYNDIKNINKDFKYSNIYEPFIRIAHHVYVNIKSFEPIRRINKVKYWYELDPSQDIQRTKRVFLGQKQEEEKKFLGMILEFIRDFLVNYRIDSTNMNEMKALYTTLDLLKITVILGLWEKVSQYRQLINLLILKIMKFDIPFILTYQKDKIISGKALDKLTLQQVIRINKQKCKLPKPELLLSIQCKNKSAEIFNLMIQMQTNIRVSNMVMFAKGIYEATENFENYEKEYVEAEYNQQDMDQYQKQRNHQNKQKLVNYQTSDEGGQNVFADVVKKFKKRIQQKQLLFQQNLWLNKLLELTPNKPDEDYQTKQCKRYLFRKDTEFRLLVLSIMENSQHFNTKLLNSMVMLIEKIFGQRKDLISNFNNVLICGHGNFFEINRRIRFIKDKLIMIQDQQILNYNEDTKLRFPYFIDKTYDPTIKQQPKRSGLIQDIFFLSRILKLNANLKNMEALMYVQKEIFNEMFLHNVNTQQQQNEPLYQSVVLVQQVHQLLFNYIRLFDSMPVGEIHKKLLFSIYQFLTLLIFNNLENKVELMKYIDDVLPQLNYGVSACNFIQQICYNNKYLIQDENICKKIITKLIECANESKKDSYQRAKFLHSLRSLVIFNEKGYERNQKLVLNILQENKYRELIVKNEVSRLSPPTSNLDFNMKGPETYIYAIFQLFSVLVESNNLVNVGKLQNIHPYSELIKYLTKRNQKTGKQQEGKQYWQIRHSVRAYINRLYYLIKQDDIFLFQVFIRNEFRIIKTHLEQLVKLYLNYNHDGVYIQKSLRFSYAGSHTYLTLVEILITLNLMLTKNVFVKFLNKQLRKNEMKQQIQKKPPEIHDYIVEICKIIGYLHHRKFSTKGKSKVMNSFLKQILVLFEPILLEFKIQYLQQKCKKQFDDPIPQQVSKESQEIIPGQPKYNYDYSKSFFRNLYEMILQNNLNQKKKDLKKAFQDKKSSYSSSLEGKKKNYIDLIYLGNSVQTSLKTAKQVGSGRGVIKSMPIKQKYETSILTSNSKYFKVLATASLNENQQNKQLNRKLTQLKTMIRYSPYFKKFQDQQFINLVTELTHLDQKSVTQCNNAVYNEYKELEGSSLDQPIISFDEILKNVFRLIILNPTEIYDNFKICVIKIARIYITQAVQKNQQYKRLPDKWDSDYISGDDEKSLEQLTKRQNKIQQCGGAEFIVSILKQNLNYRLQLLNQVLLFGIAFLFNGNQQCQNSILKVLKEDTENIMLVNLNNLINKIGSFIQKITKLEVSKSSNDNQQKNYELRIMVDTYDYFNPNQKILERKFECPRDYKLDELIKQQNQNALCRSFRFLQLFCENNNVQMKNFILIQRNQDDTQKTHITNFIETATLLLRKFFKILNKKNSAIPIPILDFINQTTQIPCLDNQRAFAKSSYFQDLCYMSTFFRVQKNRKQRQFYDHQTPLYDIYQTSIQLILSNLEGNDDQIYEQFISKIKPNFLLQTMLRSLDAKLQEYNKYKKEKHNQINKKNPKNQYEKLTYKKLDQNCIKQIIDLSNEKSKQLDENLVKIINIVIILNKMKDFSEKNGKLINKDSPDPAIVRKSRNSAIFIKEFTQQGQQIYPQIKTFIKMIRKIILQIQITTINGGKPNRQNIYFAKYPVFDELSSQTKDRIMHDVMRQTQRDKLIGILNVRQQIYTQIQSNYQMKYRKQQNYGFSITSNLCKTLRSTALYLAYIIILVAAGFFIDVDHDLEEKISIYYFANQKIDNIMKILCFIHLGISLLYFIVWLKLKTPLAKAKQLKIEKEEQESNQNLKKSTTEEQQMMQQPILYTLAIIGPYIKKTYEYISPIKQYVEQKIKHYLDLIMKTNFFYTLTCLYYHENQLSTTLMFVIISILGTFFGIQYLILHVFDIFLSNSLLANVFKSVTTRIKPLTLLAFLVSIFIYVFNIISFRIYVKSIYQQDFPDQACEGIRQCVLTLYTSGAIGDQMQQLDFPRLQFDLIYVVFMDLLMSNIIGNVMIDAFSQLKQIDESISNDKQNKCFICGNQKQKLQKNGQTISDHIKGHDLWTYLYYIYTLKNKNQTQYSGVQYEVMTKVDQQDITWFPSADNQEQQSEEDKMAQIEEQINQIVNKRAQINEISCTTMSGMTEMRKQIDKIVEIKND